MREGPTATWTEMNDVRETQQKDFEYLRDRLALLESHLGIKYTKEPRYEKIDAKL